MWPSNATPLLLAWTAIAAAGLLIVAWAQWDALGDWRYWRGVAHPRVSLLRALAWSHLRRELLRCAISTLLLLAGVGAMYRWPAEVVVGCLIGMSLTQTANVGLDWLDRHAVLRRLRRRRGVK